MAIWPRDTMLCVLKGEQLCSLGPAARTLSGFSLLSKQRDTCAASDGARRFSVLTAALSVCNIIELPRSYKSICTPEDHQSRLRPAYINHNRQLFSIHVWGSFESSVACVCLPAICFRHFAVNTTNVRKAGMEISTVIGVLDARLFRRRSESALSHRSLRTRGNFMVLNWYR